MTPRPMPFAAAAVGTLVLAMFNPPSVFAQGAAAESAPVAEATPAATPAPATPASEVTTGATKLKIGGVLWPIFTYDMTEGAKSKNSFDIGRAYVNIEPSWGDKWSARITPDVVRETAPAISGTAGTLTPGNTAGNLSVRLKYAYLTYKPMKDVEVKLGEIQTLGVDYEEGLWNHRFVAQVLPESSYGVSSADLGVSAAWNKLFGGRLDVAAGAYNGEGYQKPEASKYKEVQARASATILPAGKDPGLKLTAYYGYGLKGQNVEKTRVVGWLSYQTALFTAAAEYVMASDGGGSAGPHVDGGGPSAFAYVNLPHTLRAVARFDMVDPDKDTDDDGFSRMIVGVGCNITDKLRTMLDFQQVSYELSGKKPTQNAFLHIEAKF